MNFIILFTSKITWEKTRDDQESEPCDLYFSSVFKHLPKVSFNIND